MKGMRIAGLAAGVALACAMQGAGAAAPSIAVGEVGGSGTWKAAAGTHPDLPRHTIYRPQRWPDTPVPLYVWGNGGCSANGLAHAAYLREIASRGYLVVALGAPGGGQGARPPAAPAAGAPAAQPAGDPTTPEQMIEAIEWATRENARAGGDFRNRIDLSHIAVGGHSCGGLQALAVSHDPRIDATLVLNSGIYIRPGGRSGVAVDKTQLTRLHSPVLYLTGGPSDIAHENALDDVAKQDRVPVFFGALPVGHGGTFSAPDGGEWARVSVRWLDWHLKADADASRDFAGASCRLCTDDRWDVKQKQLPEPAGARPAPGAPAR
ncbi:MAG TPA: hypothetical protein VNQ32_13470 [Steroidobacteraceae bacterium]|nr:hypothetical protein [Steroidobacteraceae bacterium]